MPLREKVIFSVICLLALTGLEALLIKQLPAECYIPLGSLLLVSLLMKFGYISGRMREQKRECPGIGKPGYRDYDYEEFLCVLLVELYVPTHIIEGVIELIESLKEKPAAVDPPN